MGRCPAEGAFINQPLAGVLLTTIILIGNRNRCAFCRTLTMSGLSRQIMTDEPLPFPYGQEIDALGVFVVDSEAITAVQPDIIQDDVPRTEENRRFALSMRLSMM